MAIMKQLDRLKYIYKALSVTPQTVESLQNSLEGLDVSVSTRQLYRDLNDVSLYFLKDDEQLAQKSMEFNRKVWFINKQTDAAALSNYDIDTYLIAKAATPIGLHLGRGESLQKIRTLLSNHLSNSKIEYNANWDGNTFSSTHFYEIPYGPQFKATLNEIIWATSNRRSIEILSYDGDSVSLFKSLKFPFKFNPVKFIYHRGGFFVAGLIASTNQCLVLDTFQIRTYKLSNDTFPVKKNLGIVDKNLGNRFGITQNMDEQTYQIILEFNAVTGTYVQTFFWHHTQKFEELESGNLQLTLNCGINRELLGWIYQWMGDVKIVAPPKLNDLYAEQLLLIQKARHSDLTYSNNTQPD
jgi:hypothetical protein